MINCTKTEGMWISGSARYSKSKPFEIKWPDEPIKALGVYFTYDIKLLYEKNFIERLDSIKKLINLWSSRGLSIYGKVTVIKSLLIPKFVYVSSLLPTPEELRNLLRLWACIKPKSCARCAGFKLLIRAENSRSQFFFIDLVSTKVELNHDSCIFFGRGLCHWRYLATKSPCFDTLVYLVNY